MMRKLAALMSMLMVGAAAPVYAADGDQDLRDRATIIVTAGGSLAPSLSDRVAARELVGDVSQGLGNRVENRLRDVGGLVQFRRSDSRSAHPTSQGVTLRGLGGNASSRALVTLDGVPQADPFGGWVAWSAYDAVRLGGISIARGGGSGADGAGALAGSIAMFSEIGDGLAGSLAYGSRNSLDASVNVGGNVGAGSIAIDGRYGRGDGFVPTLQGQRGAVDRAAAYEQGGIGARARFDAGANSRIEASVRAFRDTRDRGFDYSESELGGVDASLRVVSDAADAAQWSALAYVQMREMTSGYASVGAGRNTVTRALVQQVPSTGMGAKAEYRPLLGGAHPLRIGADVRRTVGRTDEDYTFVNDVATRRRVAGGSSDVAGAFAEWTGGDSDSALIWTLSGRVDRWWIGEGYRRENVVAGALLTDDQYAARSGWEGSGRAGLRWQSGDFALRGAAYRGWRLPTLNELYRPFRVGADATAANEALTPERLLGADAGVDWQSNRLRLSLTGFVNRLDGAIANVTQGVGAGTFPGVGFVAAGATYSRRENLDAINSKGVEFAGGYDLGLVMAEWSYAFTDATVKASGIAAAMDGRRPAQIAKHGGSFSLRIKDQGPLGGFATLRYVGPQNEDDLGALRLDEAVTIDAGLSWRLRSDLALEVRGENILNEMVPAAISSGGLIERAAPRTLWVGLRYGL